MLEGLKPTVTPVGCPEAFKVMVESKPPEGVAVILTLPTFPGATAAPLGAAASVKLAVTGASALIRAFPFGLPHPVDKS